MDWIAADLRLAVRLLARAPGFVTAVVLVMALGIGANSAVFTALDQTVVRPLPYSDPGRLVMVWEDFSSHGVPKQRVSPATFLDWKRSNRTFEDLAAYGVVTYNLSGDGPPQEVFGLRVTASLIPLLGVPPMLGRTFTPDEERPGASAVVLSHRLWTRMYAADRGIVGQTILMNGEKHEVIGVMPPGFDFPDRDTEYWMPFGLPPALLARRNSHFLKVIGRLGAGHDVAQAQNDMTAVASRLAREYPSTNAGIGAVVVPLQREMVGDVRRAFIVLAAAAACVLLMACANVGNLLLARSAYRRREIAVRAALGAPPFRILAGLLIESLLLASAGAAGGLVVARWAIAALQRMVPDAMAGFVILHLDARVLAFTAAASVFAAIAFGLVPAIQLSQVVAVAERGAIGHGTRRLRNGLVISEVAMALVLLVCAGLLIQTLARLRAVDPGFSSRGILTASVSIPLAKYRTTADQHRFYADILERLRAIPGVRSAGLTSDLPYTSRGNTMSLAIEGRPEAAGLGIDVLFRLVSDGYLQTIGARLVDGRLLDERDDERTPAVVVVNEALARQYWPSGSALGHRIDTGTGDGATRWMTIVGVVADIRERGLDLALKPAVYVPFRQTAITFFEPSELAVLTSRDPLAIVHEAQDAVWAVDREQPVSNIKTMDAIVDEELANRTQVLELLGAFAAVALVLAALGLYAVLAFLVSQRTREIGLRMAIGARQADIVRGMLGYSARLTAAGVGIGIVVGAIATRLLSSLLFGVTPLDWRTFAAVAFLLGVVAVIASYVPTRRAANVDPVVALREGTG